MVAEQQRIADGLHDDVLQDLFGVAMSLRAAAVPEWGPSMDRVTRAADDLEHVMARLRPR